MWVKFDFIKYISEIFIVYIKVFNYCFLFFYIMLVFFGDLQENWISKFVGDVES